MALTTPQGPLGTDPAGWFSEPLPIGVVYVEPHPRRVQAIQNGRTVIDTEQALMVHRPDRIHRYAFPANQVGDLPHKPEPAAPGYVVVPWGAVDTWLEEGRLLVDYPPNPYHRVDCHRTSRRLRVEVGGVTLVDTDDTVIVFETTLQPRLYVSPTLVRTDLLRRTTTSSYCNYKGAATYWSAAVGDAVVEDVAWSYEDPPPESLPIARHLSFDSSRCTMLAELPQANPPR
ncbi:DUF427 domain-containing protein [Mycobacterium conspicuum]|uniref:Uncharacterized protein n=1 Tax=Mycobacterium conspicuum TaxID=44010 RepID=A0A1X1T0E6_9MYCO|nr:DUF427 domain-containing protein [Mycobacterium conspicuum]ORV37721.1 hypothetical protein AWC00_22230 [Mycobacterium conspicuum]BBZ41513.1 hypothetical protein MCNS_45760 [Mycobacterium conspicuum]